MGGALLSAETAFGKLLSFTEPCIVNMLFTFELLLTVPYCSEILL